MNRRRARRERRAELPPDLRAELRRRVVELAVARKAKTDEASSAYKQAEYQARQRRNRAVADAEREFRTAREHLVAEAAEQARLRPLQGEIAAA